MLLCDTEPGIGDALAAAAGAAARGVEVAGGALAEDEAAGDAAGRVDLQAPAVPLEAALDVPEVVLQGAGGDLQLPPQVLEPPLPSPQELVQPLAHRRGGLGSFGIVH